MSGRAEGCGGEEVTEKNIEEEVERYQQKKDRKGKSTRKRDERRENEYGREREKDIERNIEYERERKRMGVRWRRIERSGKIKRDREKLWGR